MKETVDQTVFKQKCWEEAGRLRHKPDATEENRMEAALNRAWGLLLEDRAERDDDLEGQVERWRKRALRAEKRLGKAYRAMVRLTARLEGGSP